MFHIFSTLQLQQYLWIIVSFVWACLIFLLFVQWLQVLALLLSKKKRESDFILNTSARRYELTFTALVIFWWSIFATFPLFYSTSFGWAFFVWYILLFLFIIEGVSFRYRGELKNFLGRKTYEKFLFINWLLSPFILWVIVSTFFTWANFVIDKENVLNIWEWINSISTWTSSFHWLEALWNTNNNAFLMNISLWITIVLLSILMGLLDLYDSIFLESKTKILRNKSLIKRINKIFPIVSVAFLLFFLYFFINLMLIDGFSYDSVSKIAFIEQYKYFHNLMEMPVVCILLIIGVTLVISWIALFHFKKYINSFWIVGVGCIYTIESILLLAGLNNTLFYPSLTDLQSSLNIENSSSSRYTLIVISYATIFIPFVIFYISRVWRQLTNIKY